MLIDFDLPQLKLALKQELQTLIEEQSLDLTELQQEQVLNYFLLMLEQNQTLNLSNITEPREVIRLHLLDSWTLEPWLRKAFANTQNFRFLDVGTGAGFPGVPVKILFPPMQVFLMDALRKRLCFIDKAVDRVGLKGIYTLHLRAEEAGRSPEQREKYDFVTARALATLPVLLEYCLPLVKPGGIFCAMKAHASEELQAAGQAAGLLGANIEEVSEFILPGTSAKRSLIFYRKTQPTPAKYPRHNAQIKKRPLS